MPKNITKDNILGRHVYIFEPIPKKNSAIASAATLIGSAGRATDKKKLTERR
jgi:hypothetical protein